MGILDFILVSNSEDFCIYMVIFTNLLFQISHAYLCVVTFNLWSVTSHVTVLSPSMTYYGGP